MLLRITFVIYLILLVYKVSSFLISFIKYYDKTATIKSSFLSFLKDKNPAFYNILEQESIILKYGFIVWKTPSPNSTNFNSYKKNPNTVVYAAFVFLVLFETAFVDFLLIKFSFHTFAKIAILTSLYLIMVFISHIKALKYRYSQIANDSLIIRYGIMNELVIPYSFIEATKINNEKPDIIPLGLLSKMEKHNVTIHFKNPLQVARIYGIKKTGNGVSFYISDMDNFNRYLSEKLEQKQITIDCPIENNLCQSN